MPSAAGQETSGSEEEARVNEQILSKGWARSGDTFDASDKLIGFKQPAGLQAVEIEGNNIGGHRVRNFVVYDPARAEAKIVQSGNKAAADAERAVGKEWEIVDSNIARRIYMKTKPQNTTEQ